MSEKKMIVIGAGIAGLAAGCYAQMNGYDTTMVEMHDKPGGLCTAWKRKGFTVDYCIHHLAGSSPASPLHKVWQELGAFLPGEITFHDSLVQVEDENGGKLTLYTDLAALQKHLEELSPADKGVIEEYLRVAKRFLGLDLLALPLLTPWQLARKVLPSLPAFAKWGKISMADYADRFTDPFLRRVFPTLQYGLPNVPMLIHLNFLAGCYNQTLGWPKGGSLAFARNIEKRFRALGGQAIYANGGEKILVESGKAVGVRLADGQEIRADWVISAADGYTTIYEMLDGKYTDKKLDSYYASPPQSCDMTIHVAFGVNRDMSKEPHALACFLNDPIRVGEEEYNRLDVEIFNFDSTLAPAGKSVLKVLFKGEYRYWQALKEDPARYQAEKQQIADIVLARLETRFPGISAQVEMVDVSTPLTVERFTGNWRGIMSPWPAADGMKVMVKGLSRTLPGLAQFYMVGQWAEGMIGISTVAVSARKAMQTICKQDGKKFKTTKA